MDVDGTPFGMSRVRSGSTPSRLQRRNPLVNGAPRGSSRASARPPRGTAPTNPESSRRPMRNDIDRRLLECHGLSEAGPDCDHNHHNFLFAELGTGVREGSAWDRDAKARFVSSGRPVLLELAVGAGEPEQAARVSHLGVRRLAAAMARARRPRSPRRAVSRLRALMRRAAPVAAQQAESAPAMCVGLIDWPYLAVARSRRGACQVLRDGRWQRIATGPLTPPQMAESAPGRRAPGLGVPRRAVDTRWIRLHPEDMVLICSDAVATVLNTTPTAESASGRGLRKTARSLVRRAQRQEPSRPATALLVRATAPAPIPVPRVAEPRLADSVRLEVPLPTPAAVPVAC